MNMSYEANEQYIYARKLAKKNFLHCLKEKKNPNLLALDEIVNEDTCAKQTLGLIEVPCFLIVGTKSSSRANSFSANFLPLLKSETEFSHKWQKVCEYHLSDSGITDPPQAIEYLGKFYIVEGNKRVSVLKSYGVVSIECEVTRLLPPKSDKKEIQLYYEFLDFYNLSKLYSIQFTKLGYYTMFQRAMGYDVDHVWERMERISVVGFEDRLIRYLNKHKIYTNHADCLAAMLEMYTFNYLSSMPDKQLEQFISDNALRLKYGKGFYKIQCIGDDEVSTLYSSAVKDLLQNTDFIISTGDLHPKYLEYIVTMANKPLFYVPGNHDGLYLKTPPEGCECLDDDVYIYQGIRILGLGGCKWYNGGPYQYTEEEMKKRINKLRWKIFKAKGIDIVVTHAPIRGYGDLDDKVHQGFECFKTLLDKYHPKFWFYGHVHAEYGMDIPRIQSVNGTILVNVSGKYEAKY